MKGLASSSIPACSRGPTDAQVKKIKATSCLWSFFGGDSKPPRKNVYHNVELPRMFSTLTSDTFLAGTLNILRCSSAYVNSHGADKEIRCCYKASLDGFSAYEFHRCCDFQGPCFVVGMVETGLQFGGFNPLGFRSTDDYYETFKAFLFYWPDQNSPPVILPKVGGCGAAVFDYARGGPQFGADGLLIGPPLVPVMGGFSGPDPNIGEGDLRQAKSRLGLSYARRPDGKESIFGDENKVRLLEVEVFTCPAIAEMY